MVGIIVSPNYSDSILDEYFDPSTHTATEANFLNLLQDGIFTEDAIGYKITLNNSAAYDGGTWTIADVNHDSSNTGQTNCYDLISVDAFNSQVFSNSTQYWRDSDVRTWLNSTFYNGFSNYFKSHMLSIKYDSNGSSYNDDKVIIPSCTELNYSNTSAVTEGIAYPIFTNNNSRIKNAFGSSNVIQWWTRSRDTSSSYIVWRVNTDGSLSTIWYNNSYYVVPTLRVS